MERLVRDGAKVRALVRYNSRNERGTLDWMAPEVTGEVDVMLGDLRDAESVARAVAGTEVVFHLGAQIAIPYSYVNPRDYVETNVTGTLNIAVAAQANDVQRVVQTSTSEVYGTAQQVPITEDHPLEPGSPYAATKVAADKLMDSFHRSFGLPVVVLRPFNTYGPHQSARAVIPTIVSQALAGDELRLGSLEPRRDLTFVTDTVDGFVRAATAPGIDGEVIQLGTGRSESIGELFALACRLIGTEATAVEDPDRLRPDASEVLVLQSDPSRARERLGWQAATSLEQGLQATIDWLRHQPRPADLDRVQL